MLQELTRGLPTRKLGQQAHHNGGVPGHATSAGVQILIESIAPASVTSAVGLLVHDHQ